MRRFNILVLLLAICFGIGHSATKAPKYIFYYIGDGMGFGAVSLAQAYNRMVLGSDSLITMMTFPIASAATTHSASSGVTDSAAAGTALATGFKTKNAMLGMDADSVPVTSISTQLKELGYGIGLVTTVAPDDATPAAHYAHVPHRSMFYEIGCQAAASGVDILAGANLRGLTDKQTGEPTDLLDVFEANGVSVVRGAEAVATAKYPRVVMLNTSTEYDNEVGLVIDSLPGVLTLPVMTQTCLDFLKAKTPDAFFMMVEGGSIDHAAHSNDPATLIREMMGFNSALDIALDFYRAHPDETLIVVTADHETGGLALANKSMGYRIEPQYLRYPSMSKDRFKDQCKALARSRMVIDWPYMKQMLTDNLNLFNDIEVSEADEQTLQEMFALVLDNRSKGDMDALDKSFNKFADEVFDVINRAAGIGWTTHDHSGAVVPVFAIGVGSELFAPLHDNTELPGIIRSLTGIGQ